VYTATYFSVKGWNQPLSTRASKGFKLLYHPTTPPFLFMKRSCQSTFRPAFSASATAAPAQRSSNGDRFLYLRTLISQRNLVKQDKYNAPEECWKRKTGRKTGRGAHAAPRTSRDTVGFMKRKYGESYRMRCRGSPATKKPVSSDQGRYYWFQHFSSTLAASFIALES